MSYDVVKQEMGKQPVVVLELDLDVCSLTYGTSPCTASGPAAEKCYNTFGTCQDKPNYTKTTKTFRFSSLRIDELQQPGDGPTFPTLAGLSTAPTKLEPGKGLGVRSSVKVTVLDHPWTDEGIDPYLPDRDFSPDDRGSFWARFLAQNQFWQNRFMRIKQGYLNDDGTYSDSNMTTRLYIIDSIAGPDTKGKIKITGKDILKFADTQRAQIPTVSNATLVGDITDSQTSFTISDAFAQISTAVSGGQQYAIINDEVIFISSVVSLGSNLYTVNCTRATLPSFYSVPPEASEHDDGDTIQDCFFYENERIDDIIFDLLNRVAGIDSSYLDTVQWADKINEGLTGYLFSRLIVEPSSARELLTEITEHTVNIWWDERDQKVLMDTLFDHTPNGSQYNDSENIIENTTGATIDIKGRVSQVWIYLGIRSPLLTDGDAKDYQQVIIRADLDFESASAYGSPAIMKIKSKWMPAGLGSVAREIASRLVRNYREAKTSIMMQLDAKDDDNWTGDIIEVATRYVKDQYGNDALKPYKIYQVDEIIKPNGTRFKYLLKEEVNTDQDSVGTITPTLDPRDGVSPFPDYNDANDGLRDGYAFISVDGSTPFFDGRPPYEVQV